MLRIVSRVLLFAMLAGGAGFAWWNHGKPIRGRANCKPVIFMAVVEAALISLAIWG